MSDVESDDAAAHGGGDGEWEDWGDEEDLTSPTKCVPPRCLDSFLARCNPPTLPTRPFPSSARTRPCPPPPTPPFAARGCVLSGPSGFQRGCLSRAVGDPMSADPRIPFSLTDPFDG